MKCEIIKDLLPVYCDSVCSEETSKEVEAHINDCAQCAALLPKYRSSFKTAAVPDVSPAKPFRRILARIRRSIVTIALLVILIAAIVSAAGYLTYGQIMRKNGGISFETCISGLKAEHLADKLCEGDMDYVTEHIEVDYPYVWDIAMYKDYMTDYSREMLTGLYEKFLKGRKCTSEWRSSCYTPWSAYACEDGSDIMYVTSEIAIHAEGLPVIFMYAEERGGQFVLFFYLEDSGEYSETAGQLGEYLATDLKGALRADYPVLIMPEIILTDKSRPDSSYEGTASYFTDNIRRDSPEYEAALYERLIALKNSSLEVEELSVGDFSFDPFQKRYTAELRILFYDPETDKRSFFTRTAAVRNSCKYAILPEYEPLIIDEGVSAEYRRMIEELF